ncbi:hypothetical protein SDJN02_00713 [Cucurbita argyrosperma subsp. argyrosperma]|nr:hypothetical protein SDJN02_00713 [Cucurbita argyrosperma subsp. argyrosperma]
MAGKEVREYTNLSDPKDKKWGKGKDKIDDEDITFQRMVAKMQEVAGERGGYLHGRGAASLADSAPASVPLALRVEPKPKSGIRQQDLLKRVVEVKRKRPRVSSPAELANPKHESENEKVKEKKALSSKTDKSEGEKEAENPVKSLLGLAYASSDEEDE